MAGLERALSSQSEANVALVFRLRSTLEALTHVSDLVPTRFDDEFSALTFGVPVANNEASDTALLAVLGDLVNHHTAALPHFRSFSAHCSPAVFPIQVRGDGDCLLHALSTACWGFADQHPSDMNCAGTLKRALEQTCCCDKSTEFVREWYNERQVCGEGAVFDLPERSTFPTDLEGWQEVVDYACTPRCSLMSIHVFVLAHVLRRPIIVLAEPQAEGGASNMRGLYLPHLIHRQPHDLWSTNVPLLLSYASGHFEPVVGFESEAATVPLFDDHGVLPCRYAGGRTAADPAVLSHTGWTLSGEGPLTCITYARPLRDEWRQIWLNAIAQPSTSALPHPPLPLPPPSPSPPPAPSAPPYEEALLSDPGPDAGGAAVVDCEVCGEAAHLFAPGRGDEEAEQRGRRPGVVLSCGHCFHVECLFVVFGTADGPGPLKCPTCACPQSP